MRYVQINSVPNGSTGGIMMRRHKELLEAGEESFVFWGRGREAENERECNFGAKAGFYLDVLRTRIDGRAGFHSKAATKRLLARLDEIDPDVVHLHNVHGYCVNVEMLFEWLAAHRCLVKWTLHDCWAFTGHCAHFTYVGCDQWKRRCSAEGACPQLDTYPKTVSKRSCARNFDDKKRLLNLVPAERMELITPSQWLANLVGESFLSKYPVTVRHNEIDRSVFKPTPSDFRERYGLEGKFVILGVASPWTERKGLDDFLRLANVLDDRYAIVLVGLTRRQIRKMPNRILSFERMEDPTDLARFYSAADLFVHPGVEETYGLTIAEAQACGAPVLVRSGSVCEEAAQNGECHMADLGFDALKSTVITGGCSVICLERTESKRQMAAIYSAADAFFNPTMEDNYPTVNLESRFCGTPVVTYDVGGCRETVDIPFADDPPGLFCGTAVPRGDLVAACSIMEEFRHSIRLDKGFRCG